MELVARLAARSVAFDAELMRVVGAIVDDVRARGDEALIDYTARFDRVELKELRVSDEELRRCAAGADERVLVFGSFHVVADALRGAGALPGQV